MRIFRQLETARAGFAPSALTIGNFDGVHAAHRELLRKVLQLAEEHGLVPSVLTFDPHPSAIVAPERAPLLLNSPDERCALMERAGIEQALILPFDRRVSALTPEEFFREILFDALRVRAIVVGDNFLFGHRQSGNVNTLKELGLRHGVCVEVLGAVRRRGIVVSSTAIRRLLELGDVERAGRLLDRPYSLDGTVVTGAGRGRRETVPTLNLEPASLTRASAALPAHGVYVTRTTDLRDGRTWPAVTNVGVRPTFGAGHVTIETFLLELLSVEPPASIRVEFLYRLRAERAFTSAEELRAQILRDVERARAYFRRSTRWIGRAKSAEPGQ